MGGTDPSTTATTGDATTSTGSGPASTTDTTTTGPVTTTGMGGSTGAGGAPSGSGGATTGMAGTSNPTGMGGTGGSGGGMGGAGGTGVTQDAGKPDAVVDKRAMDLIELKDALKNLNGFTYTNPCKFGNSGNDVTTLNGCNTGDICWATMDLGRFSENRMIPITGPAGHVYEVDLAVLGVIEPRDYPPSPNCTFEPGQPLQTISVTKCTDGFANSGSVTFNVYELLVPAPAAKYYFNAVQTHPPHRVDKADNKFTFTVNAGTTLKFTFDDLNGGEIRNCTTSAATSKYTYAAKSPFGDATPIRAPTTVAQPYNGNWFTLAVIDARVK